MRIWIGVLALGALVPLPSNAQSVVITNGMAVIAPANGIAPALGTPTPALTPQSVAPTLTPQSVAPNLVMSNATPAIGQPSITPAMPNAPAPATIPQSPGARIPSQPFTTGIGQQGSGTAIGQQGNIAIGQQGVGTAIVPETNAVVIGQPEPFNPPPNTVAVPPIGFGSNMQNRFGQQMVPAPGGGFTNLPGPAMAPRSAPTTPTVTPAVPAPTGRRR